jgi:hypothetical protein
MGKPVMAITRPNKQFDRGTEIVALVVDFRNNSP